MLSLYILTKPINARGNWCHSTSSFCSVGHQNKSIHTHKLLWWFFSPFQVAWISFKQSHRRQEHGRYRWTSPSKCYPIHRSQCKPTKILNSLLASSLGMQPNALQAYWYTVHPNCTFGGSDLTFLINHIFLPRSSRWHTQFRPHNSARQDKLTKYDCPNVTQFASQVNRHWNRDLSV